MLATRQQRPHRFHPEPVVAMSARGRDARDIPPASMRRPARGRTMLATYAAASETVTECEWRSLREGAMLATVDGKSRRPQCGTPARGHTARADLITSGPARGDTRDIQGNMNGEACARATLATLGLVEGDKRTSTRALLATLSGACSSRRPQCDTACARAWCSRHAHERYQPLNACARARTRDMSATSDKPARGPDARDAATSLSEGQFATRSHSSRPHELVAMSFQRLRGGTNARDSEKAKPARGPELATVDRTNTNLSFTNCDSTNRSDR